MPTRPDTTPAPRTAPIEDPPRWFPDRAQEAGGSLHAGAIQSRTRRLPTPVRRLLRSKAFRLATTPHGPDPFLQQFNPLWSVDTTRALLVDTRRETPDATTLTFDPGPEWVQAEAGQYVQLTVSLGGRRRTRCFSISSGAGRTDGLLSVTVKTQDDGFVSRFLHDHARPGLVVELSPPAGEFTLPTPRPDHVVLVSGGSGITPTMAILRTLIDESHAGRIDFLHYARTADDRIFATELDALDVAHTNLNVVTVLTGDSVGEDSAPGHLHGHLSREHLDHLTDAWQDAEAWVCGPGALLEAADEVWAAAAAEERLHVERFTLHTTTAAGAGEGTLRLATTDLTVDDDGRPILSQAEDAGLTPDFGCRMGICKTCTTRKIAGVTQNLSSGDVSREDNDDIQICVSVALGDVELDL